MAKDVGWDDPNIRGGGSDDDKYKVEKDKTDVIRVLGTPVAYMIHWVPGAGRAGKGRYFNCTKDEKGQEVDCPNCEEHGESTLSEKYACLVMHLYRGPRGIREWKADHIVGRVKGWQFGGDKYAQLFEIQQATEGRLTAFDLRVSTTKATDHDAQMQDLNITQMGESCMKKSPGTWKEAMADFKKNKDSLTKRYLTSKTADEIRSAADEADEFDPEKLEAETRGGASPPKSTAKPAAEAEGPAEPESPKDNFDQELDDFEKEISPRSDP